jgi:hypothetical protein
MEANFTLIRKIKNRLEDLEDFQVEMNYWVGSENIEGLAELLSDKVCNTSGCLVGHGVAIETGKLTYIPGKSVSVVSFILA